MSKLTVIASYNMSWIHEDQRMLAVTQGIPFWSSDAFTPVRKDIGQTILELTDKVVQKNLRDEMALAESSQGLPQVPTVPSKQMTTVPTVPSKQMAVALGS